MLVAIFGSVFALSQLVLSMTWDRRRERDAVNKRLRMMRAGVDRETVALTLLKNVPRAVGPLVGAWVLLVVPGYRELLLMLAAMVGLAWVAFAMAGDPGRG